MGGRNAEVDYLHVELLPSISSNTVMLTKYCFSLTLLFFNNIKILLLLIFYLLSFSYFPKYILVQPCDIVF